MECGWRIMAQKREMEEEAQNNDIARLRLAGMQGRASTTSRINGW